MPKTAYVKNSENITPLNAKRLELGLTEKALAAKIGVVPQAIHNWMSGKCLPGNPQRIVDLAEILGVTSDWIVDNSTKSKDYTDTHKTWNRWENFWTTTRDKAGFSGKEVTDLLNIERRAKGLDTLKTGTVCKYFTGQSMPPEEMIIALCNIFDVDVELGTAEFIKAYNHWHTRGESTIDTPIEVEKQNMITYYNTPDINVTFKCIPEEKCETPKMPAKEYVTEDILNKIYGNISCQDFCYIYDLISSGACTSDIPRLVYNKVDFDTFNQIWNLWGKHQ